MGFAGREQPLPLLRYRLPIASMLKFNPAEGLKVNSSIATVVQSVPSSRVPSRTRLSGKEVF